MDHEQQQTVEARLDALDDAVREVREMLVQMQAAARLGAAAVLAGLVPIADLVDELAEVRDLRLAAG